MEPMRWTIVQSEQDPIKFVRKLALLIWKPENLVNRAVVIKKVYNRNKIPGRSPVKELERDKLKLLISKKFFILHHNNKFVIITNNT